MSDKKDCGRGHASASIASILQEPLTIIALTVFLLAWARVFLGEGTIFSIIPGASLVLGVLSCYFTYLYLKGKKKRYNLLGIPLLIFIVTLFIFYSNTYAQSGVVARDYTMFALAASFFLLFYTLSTHNILGFDTGVITALFLSTMLLHVIPAYSPYLAALDPYFYLKLSESTMTTGFLPDHEYSVYPLVRGIQGNTPDMEPGIDYARSAFFLPIYLSYAASINSFLGLTLYDTAIIYPALFSALTVVLIYLLVAELFSDSAPYNRIAAFIAAFILMVSPAYAAKATATNCEDDTLGMFIMVASLLFFVAAFKRKEMKYVYLAGLSFFLLRISWSGYLYTVLILGIFSILYSIARFLNKKDCFNHITYLLACIIPSFLTPLILHARGDFPHLRDFFPYDVNLVVLGGMVFTGALLEFIQYRTQKKKGDEPAPEGNMLDGVNAWVRANSNVLLALVVVLAIVGIMFIGVEKVTGVIESTLESRKQDDVIKKTISEQHPLAASIGEYLAVGPQKFSILFLYALLMTPVLLYRGFSKADFPSLFVLALGLPMLYGVYFKSQYIFIASLSITIMGSTVGVYSIAKRKDFESLRIVGLLLVLVVPFITVPFFGTKTYSNSIAMIPMHMGPSGDRYYWDPALTWLRHYTQPNDAVLTWWDYGHWITSESQRPVLIDNLQADPWQIQDVARFFVNKTTEEEAMETFRAYQDQYKKVTQIYPEGVDLRYVVIDWTMIGKGSALHFIATGNIDTKADGDFRNYAICGFYPQASDTTPRIMSDEDGNMFLGRRIIFACSGYVPGIEFLIREDTELAEINVILNYGQKVPWKSWIEHNDASILGVQPLYQIISLAIQNPTAQLMPQFRSIIYVPDEFSDFMMTRLYLSDHIDTVYNEGFCTQEANKKSIGCRTYLSEGLYNREYTPLKNFRLVQDFSNGYVRAYERID
ncbi:MAG: STT3 domain-containing protein [Candidatus Altiarchaeota archaeon]